MARLSSYSPLITRVIEGRHSGYGRNSQTEAYDNMTDALDFTSTVTHPCSDRGCVYRRYGAMVLSRHRNGGFDAIS